MAASNRRLAVRLVFLGCRADSIAGDDATAAATAAAAAARRQRDAALVAGRC